MGVHPGAKRRGTSGNSLSNRNARPNLTGVAGSPNFYVEIGHWIV
jgi:hypothetical protein